MIEITTTWLATMRVLIIAFDPSNVSKSAAITAERIREFVSTTLDPIIPGADIFTYIQKGKPNVMTIIPAKLQIDLLRPDAVLFVTSDGDSSKAKVARFSTLDKETVLRNGELVSRRTLACSMKKTIKRAGAPAKLSNAEQSFLFLQRSVGDKLFGWIRMPPQLQRKHEIDNSSSISIDNAVKSVLAGIHAMVIYLEDGRSNYTSGGLQSNENVKPVDWEGLMKKLNDTKRVKKTSKAFSHCHRNLSDSDGESETDETLSESETEYGSDSSLEPASDIRVQPSLKKTPQRVKQSVSESESTTNYLSASCGKRVTKLEASLGRQRHHKRSCTSGSISDKVEFYDEYKSISDSHVPPISSQTSQSKTGAVIKSSPEVSSKIKQLVPAIRKSKYGTDGVQEKSVKRVSWISEDEFDVSSYCPDEDEWECDSYSLESETSEDWEIMFS